MRQFFLILILSVMISTVSAQSRKVVISTTLGDITIKLYDETPLHRDNFVKLVESGFYEDLLFHRVINNFMVQGGDPDSKGAPPERSLGMGGPGYNVDAEIVYPQFFHKKGALAAARTGDQMNPQRKSSGSQFYIVHGRVYTHEEVDQLEQSIISRQSQLVFGKYAQPHIEEFIRMQAANDTEGIQKLQEQVLKEAAEELEALRSYKIPDDLREAYTTIGGTPHLDDAYTVFGEVVEGFEVIDRIASVETNASDRPLQDVVMKMKIVAE